MGTAEILKEIDNAPLNSIPEKSLATKKRGARMRPIL
jgi:hypothetical protein